MNERIAAAEAEKDRASAEAYDAYRRHRKAIFERDVAYEAEKEAQRISERAHCDYAIACRKLADVLAEALTHERRQ